MNAPRLVRAVVHRWGLLVALTSCSEPPRRVVNPPQTAAPTAATTLPPAHVPPAAIDDAPILAVPPGTTVDGELPASVVGQQAQLAAWLTDGDRAQSDEVLQARLRVAGLLGLGRAKDYLRKAQGRSQTVLREAKLAARRRLGIHRPEYKELGVAGSSVSAGFLGEGVARLLAEAAPDASVHDVSATLYFRKSVDERRALLEELVREKPALTLALDFLFWWTHGREAHQLEEGLAQLDRIPGILVLGTVPRMTSAKRWIMSRVRSAEAIARINARINAWSAERPHVIVVPLHQWYGERDATTAPLPEDSPVEADALFARDGLHLTALGTRFVVRRTLAEVGKALPDAPPPPLSWR